MAWQLANESQVWERVGGKERDTETVIQTDVRTQRLNTDRTEKRQWTYIANSAVAVVS